MNCEIVPYSPELEPLIAQLQTHLWSPDASLNHRYFRWKYLENPALPDALVSVALSSGRAVAMRGLSGALWQVGDPDSRHPIPYADDFVVAPAHRNSGVAARVMQASLETAARHGFAFAVNLSASPITFVNSLANGWRSAGSFGSVWRESAAAGGLIRRLGPIRRLLAPSPFARLDRAKAGSGGAVVVAREPRPEAMAALIERLPWDGRIRMLRDARYLTWRFRNPLHEYRFLFWDEGRLEGFIVLQRYRMQRVDPWVNIVDLEAADDRIRSGLLSAALDLGEFPRVHAWTVGTGEGLRRALSERGFVAPPAERMRARSRGLLIRKLGGSPPGDRWRLGGRDLLRIDDWDLRLAYSMSG